MRPIIPDYLAEVLRDVESDTSGELAGYIPELAAADPERLGAAFAMIDGEVYGAGDIDIEFTIQSWDPDGSTPTLASTGSNPRSDSANA
ncbi:glutaminase [Streptomyces malaysiensis]|uniref:glutaminase n=1 Tax=Streptomyces malaysiensis TaxID=92644 RepID=UPI002B2A9000|nr:glutaminase [Streptomyces malaysiensis]